MCFVVDLFSKLEIRKKSNRLKKQIQMNHNKMFDLKNERGVETVLESE